MLLFELDFEEVSKKSCVSAGANFVGSAVVSISLTQQSSEVINAPIYREHEDPAQQFLNENLSHFAGSLSSSGSYKFP